jgi:hypothetical protein
MKNSLQMSLRDVHLHKVTDNFAEEAKGCVTERHGVTWSEIPESSFDAARLQRKVVADDMGKSNSWFCRALKGIEKLGWDDFVVIQDKRFWQEIVDKICLFHDLPPRGTTAQDLEYIRIGKAFVELQQQAQRSVGR